MLAKIIQSELSNIPMYLLQSTAVIGILAVLMVLRGKNVLSNQKSNTLGIVLGLTSFLLSGFVSDFIQLESKPYLRNDLIFLAGFFGGLRNASWVAILSWVGRVLFGGSGSLLWSGVDIVFIAYGSVLIRNLFFKDQSIDSISFKQALNILLWRYSITVLPIVIFLISKILTSETAISILVRRTLGSFTISVFILYTMIILLRREIQRENNHLIDDTSGLPNRRALQKKIKERLESFNENNEKATQIIFLVVIRNLYELVHEHNHNWTDNYYRQLSKQMLTISSSNLLNNYTPDIYAFSDQSILIVLDHIDASSVLKQGLAQKLLYQLHPTRFEEAQLSPMLTIGIIEIALGTTVSNAPQFLRSIALMEAYKHEPVHCFELSIAQQIDYDKKTRKNIEQWIESGVAPLWLQPKIQLSNGKCIGAELLLRALKSDDVQNYEMPPYILAIAERFHLLDKLEMSILETAINYMQQLPKLKISVNLSPISLSTPNFGKEICLRLKEKDINPKNLTVEIIETAKLITTTDVLNNITEMTGVGISFSLDDFGAGYASLSLMSKLPFSELKLDYSMISSIEQPRTLTAILAAIDTAKRYVVHIVAEGIETESQKEQLIKMGITYGQGYLFAKAMPIDQFIKFVAKNNQFY